MKKLFLLSTLCVATCISTAQIIHIPADYSTIQAGIDASSNGDTVLVSEGTYLENIIFKGKAITVASNFIIDSDTNHIFNTIIDGSKPENQNIGSVVTFINGEDTTSILNGFTITGGIGLEIAAQRMGGGIVCFQSGAKILNNKIMNNELTYTGMTPGGGICSFFETGESWVVIENNTISGNVCTSTNDQAFGGGIAVGTNARIVNNSINNNQCNSPGTNGLTGGGGLYIASSSLLDSVFVKSNEINNNTLEAYYCYGAGIYNAASILYLRDNVINSNTNIGTYCYGSAMLLMDIDGEITVENNLISENINQSVTVGAATILLWSVLDWQSKVNIKNNTINNNSATGTNRWGTAIHLKSLGDFLVVIDGNIIKGNEGFSGSGLYARSSFNYRLTNNVFTENDVSNIGGAIYNSIVSKDRDDIYFFLGKLKPKPVDFKSKGSFHPLIANNTFVGNHSDDLGGAVYLASTYDSLCPVFINNIFKDNTADGMDYEIHHSGDEELLISNNNIDVNMIYGNWDGTGNIAGEPDFLEDTLFHIDNSSPCFNAGIESVLHDGEWYASPVIDYEHDPRPLYGGVDIGADEYFNVGIDLPYVKTEKSIIVNYPNPFSNSTTIEYKLKRAETVIINIFNYLGERVDIIREKQTQGVQKIVWSADKLPAGIYYIRLQAGEQLASGKMVMVR